MRLIVDQLQWLAAGIDRRWAPVVKGSDPRPRNRGIAGYNVARVGEWRPLRGLLV
jgi:hypothetical protein